MAPRNSCGRWLPSEAGFDTEGLTARDREANAADVIEQAYVVSPDGWDDER